MAHASDSTAPATAKATANPKPVNFYVNYRGGIIRSRHAPDAPDSVPVDSSFFPRNFACLSADKHKDR